MSQLPDHGEQLLALRKSGKKPSELVLIRLCPGAEHSNFTLSAKPAQRYDWRLVTELDVELLVNTRVPFSAVLQTLADLAESVPNTMSLAYTEGPRIDCGQLRRVDGVPLFDWFPQAVGLGHYAEAAAIAKRLAQNLGGVLPTPYDEIMAMTNFFIQEDPRWHA